MTYLPKLERQLVSAATSRRRRRIRRVVNITIGRGVAAGVVVAATVAAVLALNPSTPDVERPASRPASPVTPAQVVVELGRTYGVFERERTAADELPPTSGGERAQPFKDTEIDFESSRLVAQRGSHQAFATAATYRGLPAVCTMVALEGRSGGVACMPFRPADADRRPPQSRITTGGRSLYFLMLPDGTSQVRLTLRGGGAIEGDVTRNGVLLGPTDGASAASWVDASGSEHVVTYHDDKNDDTD